METFSTPVGQLTHLRFNFSAVTMKTFCLSIELSYLSLSYTHVMDQICRIFLLHLKQIIVVR